MLFKTLLKYGAAMGLGFCLYTMLMWLTRLDTTYLNIGQYLDIAILIWPIAMIFLAIRSAMSVSRVSIARRFGIAFVVGLVSFVIYAPFLYAYHNYINPTWFDAVIALQQGKMAEQNTDPVLIAEQVQKMKDIKEAQSGMLNGLLPSVIILPAMIALISLPFIRNRRAAFE